MSWSLSAVGTAAAVRRDIDSKATQYKCAEPEETIKLFAVSTIDSALNAFPQDYPVEVRASGSQSPMDGGFVNSLTIQINPLWGFVK